MRALLDFLLFDWLKAETLCARPRHAGQSREDYAQMLDACERVAREVWQSANRACDTDEPKVDADGKVQLPASTARAVRAYFDTGLHTAGLDAEHGGLQLPCMVEMAGNAFFSKASPGCMGYPMLSVANTGLLLAHGTPAQIEAFARPQIEGRWLGTMCLSEPAIGSSLGDLTTRAEADGGDALGARYRLKGSKMWISAGEHELAENIVHLVLAKVPREDGSLPEGSAGISLFIVPKFRPDGTRNGVSLVGLNHKLGWRGTSNCLLNFGESDAALGWRVGAEGQGLAQMFHMMNEARIGVGLGAAMLAMAGYEVSRAYAAERVQGRAPGRRGGPQQPLNAHADVRRMLLQQKAVAEGALALNLFCARLVDEQRSSGPDAEQAAQLLALLIPVAKSWPSQWGLEANSQAIQVLGGAGYTRDWPVEQFWRDQRLNMIHEGTHGIQGLDLLLRKASQPALVQAFAQRVNATVQAALAEPDLAEWANQLAGALALVGKALKSAWASGDPAQAALHATPVLQGFGHLVLAWIWLDLHVAARGHALEPGLRAACAYFFAYELPLVQAWLQPVLAQQRLLAEVDEAAL
ncbi:MAG: acyl-CoA dehydrogenase [Burkholderiales bacterium]|uniref:acyl-CoA dehydrogenase n=1 Tax=Inhella sp. TaxID=1921806 RepID=UPI001AC0E99F|nr:acyl-CoA dehydrogenase [Burkholderiales bacterium]